LYNCYASLIEEAVEESSKLVEETVEGAVEET